MKQHATWGASLLAILLPLLVFPGEATKTGIITGTVTIGGKPTMDAVVSVEGLPQENLKSQISNLKSKKAVMDQQDLKFLPRVLAVLVGTTVDFPNHDKTFHNVFSTSEAKKFDLGLYLPGKSRSVTFDKAGVARILCNVHPNMEAYVVVKNHPYFATPGKRGNYRINAVPLGQYRLEVWHPDFGTKVVSFDLVREGEVLTLNVDLKK